MFRIRGSSSTTTILDARSWLLIYASFPGGLVAGVGAGGGVGELEAGVLAAGVGEGTVVG
jgi:hypothetical protein